MTYRSRVRLFRSASLGPGPACPRAAFLLFAMAMAWGTAARAAANGRFPQSNYLSFHPADVDVLTLRTTFGLLVTRDGGRTWRWVCEEVMEFRPTEDPAIARTGDGFTIVSLFGGLRRGTPDDCAFPEPDPFLAEAVMVDNTVDPSDPHRVYVLPSSGGRSNQPWRSDDDGATWRPLGESVLGVLFETIEVAPSRPERIYLTGAAPPTGREPRRAFVFRSDDGGTTFDQLPFTLLAGPEQNDRNPFLAGVDPVVPDRVYVRVRGEPDDRLVISDDGGETFREVLRLPAMYGFARSDDGSRVWVGSDVVGLYRSDDRGETFVPVPGGVLRVNCLAARGDELWACGNDFVDGFALGVSRDGGATFEPKLRYRDIVGIPECAPEAPVTVLCAPRIAALQAMFRGGASDSGVSDAGAADFGVAADLGMARDPVRGPDDVPSGCCSAAAGAYRPPCFGDGDAGTDTAVTVVAFAWSVAAFVRATRRRGQKPRCARRSASAASSMRSSEKGGISPPAP